MYYKQKNITIGNKLLPEIKYKTNVYYPLTYTFEKILLKNKQSVNVLKKRGYDEHLIQLKVNFNFNKAGTQNTYCISKIGLIELLQISNVGGLTVKQKQGMNLILDYFGLDLINEDPRFLDTFDYQDSNNYDVFEKDCIEGTLKTENNLKWQRCKDCGKYYPLHKNFFSNNSRDNIFTTTCRNCRNTDVRHRIGHPNNYLNYIYNTYGENAYVIYKNNNVISIYNHYIESDLSSMPKPLNNKKSYLKIIKYLYDNDMINKDNITLSLLINKYKLKSINSYLTSDEIYYSLFGDNPRNYPWKYKKFSLSSPTKNEIIKVFNNYLTDNNIKINDIYDFNYYDIIVNSGLRSSYGNDLLKFVMDFYDNEYPAYKFNIASVSYWKGKENRNRALKHLIEKDMKLEIEKIPLYLTITSLQNIGTKTMYGVLKKYYGNLYEWVNDVYPDIFDPKDFDINYMRNEFDSIDEHTIDEILRDNFDNVLYNPRNTEHTITLLGKVPDWFIFTSTGVIVVEYFGLWAKRRGIYNSRTRDYINSSKDKIKKYKTLQGYNFLYMFPEDLDNNYEGLYKKIDDIKNNKKLKEIV
ncbi:hypothetical protein ACR77J_07920 [Tissierella praeacuta]|uniref:hypothetical protein n=1 Tax=Tissierella praeacuta TaxID=43131 RepID=UPI003DA65D84